AANPVELMGRVPSIGFVVSAGLGLRVAGIGRPVGDQKSSKEGGHLRAGGIVLSQEARKRTSRDRFQQTAWTLMAGRASPREYLGRTLAGLQILRLRK